MIESGTKKRAIKKQNHLVFDKYELYTKAVQSPEGDVEFIRDTYKEIKGKLPKTLREDFCGTFALSSEWVKLDKKNQAYGVDLDPEPMEYGRGKYYKKLSDEQKKRLHLVEGDVLKVQLPKVDVTAALNFSYSLFKTRDVLKSYFKRVYESLNKEGVFIVDMFGGGQCHDAIEDRIKHKKFTYYWDQTGYDPVTNEALFYIHFKIGSKKIEKVFTYDWRIWTIPEVREIMEEVGFKKSYVYWEGTTKAGHGNGIFSRTEKGEPCLSWIAYVAGEK